MLADFFTYSFFGGWIQVWQLLCLVVLIVLIIFLIQYRKRQM